jgi:putative heme-binding domain-containing protein
VFPTAIACAPDGTVYLGQDPMDMPGPPTVPADSVVAIKGGKVTVFADKLWAVMGLEWVDDTLYVVHAPFLSSFRDTDGDGRADVRSDLVTGLGPTLPGFSGINDHVASGIRLGMDGFLYIAIGDKGIPRGAARDGTTIQLFGGGVIRVRPDGTGLEVISTGERNPLSVALTTTDEIFTYGNDDDSKQWPNSLTHHILGGHYGYPYQFLHAPTRALPIVAGELGGAGAQALFYNEAGLPSEYEGNLFACDWGRQAVYRYVLKRAGATFEVASKSAFVMKGELADFRPFSMGVGPWGECLYLVDWAYNGWLANGPRTGRLYRLTHTDAKPYIAPLLAPPIAKPEPPFPLSLKSQTRRATAGGNTPAGDSIWIERLDDPSPSCRLRAQRGLAREFGPKALQPLITRLKTREPVTGRLHAIWALDALDEPAGRAAIRDAMADTEASVRCQAVRSAGIARDQKALSAMLTLLKDDDPVVRREAAVALGKLGSPTAEPALLAAISDRDVFVAWSVRHALRTLGAWNVERLSAALVDPARRNDALALVDETWAVPVVDALVLACRNTVDPAFRARLVTALAGLARKYPAWSGLWFGTNPLAGAFPQKTEPWDKAGMEKVQSGLAAAIVDAEAKVRLPAIAGLLAIGRPALPALRAALVKETDPKNLEALATGLGILGDFASAPALGAIAQDRGRPEAVRASALDALGRLRGPQALSARIALVYDPEAPAALVARALPALGREGIIPPNDLAGFLEKADPRVRSAGLLALTARKEVPLEVRQAVLARLDDPDDEVKRAAMEAAAALGLETAVPRLLAIGLKEELRRDATLALARLPNPRALPVFLAALGDKSPDVRRAGELALLAIRDRVEPELQQAARSGTLDGLAALRLERVLTRFVPVTSWKVIGPFARTTAEVFVGDRSLEFSRTHTGANGRSITWTDRAGDKNTGRVLLDDFKAGAGDRGGFGYDSNGSPDLCALAYAEVISDTERNALLLLGSSGSILVTVNEVVAFDYDNLAGRTLLADGDLLRVALKKGTNRILVKSRQGIGSWAFSAQLSLPTSLIFAAAKRTSDVEALRAFALSHEGDPRSGEALFFDIKGVGCAKCHSAAGRGQANIGPDLTGLALKYDKTEIVRSVLEPSSRIATGYQPVILGTRDGRVHTGLVRTETDAYVEIADSEAKVMRVPKASIEDRRAGYHSVMPANLVEPLSVVEFADLVSFLSSLRAAPVASVRSTARP